MVWTAVFMSVCVFGGQLAWSVPQNLQVYTHSAFVCVCAFAFYPSPLCVYGYVSSVTSPTTGSWLMCLTCSQRHSTARLQTRYSQRSPNVTDLILYVHSYYEKLDV